MVEIDLIFIKILMKYQVSIAVAALLGATNCINVQREPLLSWAPTPADSGPPKDYFVPHFGTDEDMKSVPKSIAAAEVIVGAKFNPDMSDK